MTFMDNQSILITGGTGSFGKAMTKYLLETNKASRIAIFSRDELKQSDMRLEFNSDPRLRFFIGDIRDQERLRIAMRGVDTVIHAAALKQVDTGEYNPMEFVKTNVIGSNNVIMSAMDCSVTKVIALSTDKASSPINLYGATKLTADKLFLAANSMSSGIETRFSVVRYGNVFGSRGSVVPYFLKLARENRPISLTDRRMTRFWITIERATKFVSESLEQMQGGELFVPIIPSMKITDLIEALAPKSEIVELGIRPGEKIHEELISLGEGSRTVRQKDKFIVGPVSSSWGYKHPEGKILGDEFFYRSDQNETWLSASEIHELIKELKP